MSKQPDIKEVLAFYHEGDWAECACNIVRRFGISGAAGIIKSLRDIIGAIDDIGGILGGGLELFQNFDDVMARLIPGNLVSRLSFDKLRKVHICPLFSDLLMSVSGKGIDIVRGFAIDDFISSKHKYIGKAAEEKAKHLNNYRMELLRLERLITTVEGCVSVGFSEGKDYRDEVLGLEAESPKAFDRIAGDVHQMMGVNSTTVNGELWTVYQNSSRVYIQRKVGETWQTPVFVSEGDFPTIFFDGTFVRMYWRYNQKVQEAEFEPHQLGLILNQKQLWDCFKYYDSHGSKGATSAYYECGVNTASSEGTNLMSFPDGGRGIYPTTTIFSDNYLRWNALTISGFTTTYEVYREGVLIWQGSDLAMPLAESGIHWVVGVFTDVHFGREYRGCRSNLLDVPPFVAVADLIGDWDAAGFETSVTQYEVRSKHAGSSQIESHWGATGSKEVLADRYVTSLYPPVVTNYQTSFGASSTKHTTTHYFAGGID